MKTMATALGCLVVFALALFTANRMTTRSAFLWGVPTAHLKPTLTAAGNSSGGQNVNPDDLNTVVPDGTQLTFDEFQKRAPDVASLLSPLKPTHIARSGSTFTLTCQPTTISKQGVTVYVSKQVSCQATKNGNVITLTKISGVDVSLGVGTQKLREAVITPGATNTASVAGKLEVSSWLPYVPFNITVDVAKIKTP